MATKKSALPKLLGAITRSYNTRQIVHATPAKNKSKTLCGREVAQASSTEFDPESDLRVCQKCIQRIDYLTNRVHPEWVDQVIG